MKKFRGNKVLVVGDVHGNFDLLYEIYKSKNPDIILQCGDFGYFPKFDEVSAEFKILKHINCPVLFCDGNHDDHSSLSNLVDGVVYDYPNIQHVSRGAYIEVNGKNIMFMGGADSIDKNIRTIGVDWWPEETISYNDMYNLPPVKIDTIISHTCPETFLRDNRIIRRIYLDNDPSREALDQLLSIYNPNRWFFGHWHCFVESQFRNTHWTCLNKVDRCNGSILDENNCWCWLN